MLNGSNELKKDRTKQPTDNSFYIDSDDPVFIIDEG